MSNADGTIDYWSVKRQTIRASGWTLSKLAAKDDRGRSILGDLLTHIERNPANRGVFASRLGTPDFDELRECAADPGVLEARLNASQKLCSSYRNTLLPLCGNDPEKAQTLLLRVRTLASNEPQLRDWVEFMARKLLHMTGGAPIDPAAIRGHLCDLLIESIHRPIRKETILEYFGCRGIRLSSWAVETTVTDRIRTICDSYCQPLRSQLVNGTFINIPGSNTIFEVNGLPTATKVLLIGGAGGGKSSSLAMAVSRLMSAGIPAIPIRFDQLPEGILSTTELGRKLGLPESPSLTLAAVSEGKPCVLVVDQLDAVSIASGRRAEVWALFDSLRREVERFPNVYLLVGCREFDLEHDHRMRGLKAGGSGFVPVKLEPLRPEQVDTALSGAGILPTQIMPSLKLVLAVPLHLSMFLDLPQSVRLSVHGRDELFDQFWLEKERRTTQRLHQRAAWTEVIDALSNWLSEHQQLSAPQFVLDSYRADASAMASEHVLVLADGRFRFFHESFFDYAFARRFASRGQHLVDLLLSGEQHLFRRAQVRQILTYLRTKDVARYLKELESILTTEGVRFHIKSSVFQWMSALPDPGESEWSILEKLIVSEPSLRSHVRGIVMANEGWFDVLDHSGFFRDALLSNDVTRQNEAIWLLAQNNTMTKRSARVATLVSEARGQGESWKQFLHHICRNGDVYHSREMFKLFLSLMDDGTLDGLRPGFAVNDDWWSTLYLMAEKAPDLTSEAIGHWFDRALVIWGNKSADLSRTSEGPTYNSYLWKHLDDSGNGSHVILAATKSPAAFVEQILPRVAKFINETAEHRGDRLQIDPLFSSRTYGDSPVQVHSALLSGLAKSMQALAKADSVKLNKLTAPIADRPHDAIAYLVLRAWTAAPDTYSDTLSDFLAADPRRLKVGYSSWGGSGSSAANHTSSQAVKAASSRCSQERLKALEEAIINLADEFEFEHPQYRGLRQLELLREFDPSRLSSAGRAKLSELQAKFPNFDVTVPKGIEFGVVGSPLPEEAQSKMSDENWLGAMRKYAGIDRRRDRSFTSSGGEHQLAQSIEQKTKADPVRFAALAEKMPDDMAKSYFDAILRGVAGVMPQSDKAELPTIPFASVVQLLRRVGRLPGRPCGQWFAFLICRWKSQNWPDDIVDLIAWYAINDPDPDSELWKTPTGSGRFYHNGDPYQSGFNSTRGSMANAITQLLFENPTHFARLKDAVYSLSHDRSVAVRACAIEALIPLLNFDVATAIDWFKECLSLDIALLTGKLVEHFLHFAVERDYIGVRSILLAMLDSGLEKAVAASSRQICIAALDDEAPKPDATRVHQGTPLMRKAAAQIYSGNIANKVVGAESRILLKPFFCDSDEAVRAEAAMAFRHIAEVPTEIQAELLAAFFDTNPGASSLEQVVRALEDSPVQLPDLVCKLAERCIDIFKDSASDFSKSGVMVAMDLNKIVLRLYTQTADPATQSRCLSMIDEMERYHFLGLSDELRKLDR